MFFLKKSKLFCFHPLTRPNFSGKTNANQTIDCGLYLLVTEIHLTGYGHVHKYEAVFGYFVDNVLCSKNDKIVTDILKKPGNKKEKNVTLMV